MSNTLLESLEKSIQDDQFVIEKIKREYRNITPLEAFSLLGESKSISRILKDNFGRLQILDVAIVKQNYGEYQDYYVLQSNGYRSDTENLTNDLFVKEWFVKL